MSLFRTALRPLRSIPTTTATALRTMSSSATPMEDAIREKVPTTYLPTYLPLQSARHKTHKHMLIIRMITVNSFLKPLDPPHPQRLTPPRPPRRDGRVGFARDAFSVRPPLTLHSECVYTKHDTF